MSFNLSARARPAFRCFVIRARPDSVSAFLAGPISLIKRSSSAVLMVVAVVAVVDVTVAFLPAFDPLPGSKWTNRQYYLRNAATMPTWWWRQPSSTWPMDQSINQSINQSQNTSSQSFLDQYCLIDSTSLCPSKRSSPAHTQEKSEREEFLQPTDTDKLKDGINKQTRERHFDRIKSLYSYRKRQNDRDPSIKLKHIRDIRHLCIIALECFSEIWLMHHCSLAMMHSIFIAQVNRNSDVTQDFHANNSLARSCHISLIRQPASTMVE